MWCAKIVPLLNKRFVHITTNERHKEERKALYGGSPLTNCYWRALLVPVFNDDRRPTVQVLPVHLLNAATATPTARWGGGLV